MQSYVHGKHKGARLRLWGYIRYGGRVNWLRSSTIGQLLIVLGALLLARHFIRMYLVVLIKKAVASNSKESAIGQQKRVDTLVEIVGTLLTLGLAVIGVGAALVILDVNIAALIAGLGAAGVAFGLIAQSLIKDVIAGFFIIMENQYRVGDVVTLGSVTGTVEEITLRITRLRDFNGDVHIVPNGASEVITNKTFGWSSVILEVGVSYDADIDKVTEVINEVGIKMSEDEQWAQYITEPIGFLRVDNFGDSSVNIKAIGRVEAGEQWSVAGEYRSRLKKAFDKAGIEIPFPQRVVHTKKSN